MSLLKIISQEWKFLISTLLIFFLGMIVPILGGIFLIAISFYYGSKKHSEKLLLLFLFVLCLSDSRSHLFEVTRTFKPILILILFICSALYMRLDKPKNRIFLYILPFWICSLFISLIAPNIGIAFQKTLSYGLLFYSIPCLVIHSLSVRKEEFLNLILASILSFFIISISLYKLSPNLAFLLARYRGLLGNPNGMGLFCSLCFIVFFILFEINKNIISKKNQWIVLGLILFNLILTGARTGLMTIIIFFIFYRLNKISKILSLFLFILSVWGYSSFLSWVPELVVMFGLEEYIRLDNLEEASGRLVAWEFAWEQIQSGNYWFGRGFTYDTYVFFKHKLELSLKGHQGNVHNTYLTLWLNTGLIGLSLFVLGMWRIILSISKSRLSLPFFFAISFSCMFESWLTASLNPFTIMFLIGISLIYYHQIALSNEEN